ncbi:hypothetical protein K501DRAFT_161087, partial [Backusella circina FSU 941]
ISLLLYADDCVIISTPENMQFLLDACTTYSHNLGFRWNASKSIILTHPLATDRFFLDSEPVPFADDFTYLGIPISSPFKINPLQLIQKNSARALQVARSLKAIGLTNLHFPPLFIKKLYNTFIRPCFEYGLAIACPNISQHLPKLDSQQSQALNLLFGGHSRSSVKVLRHLLDIPSASTRHHILTFKYLNRLVQLLSDTLVQTLLPLFTKNTNKSFSHQWYKILKSS